MRISDDIDLTHRDLEAGLLPGRWIQWTGTENPAPGRRVQIQMATDPGHAYDAHADVVVWDNRLRSEGLALLAYRVTPDLTAAGVTEFCRDVFADNLAAGWWSDLQTGAPIERNVGELLMLITTEIAEAAEGWDLGLPDDKLPQRAMFEVELADTAIRVFDLGGGLGLDLGAAFGRLRAAGVRGTVGGAGTPFNLLLLVRHVSAAMEAHRRGNRDGLERALATLLLGVDELATDLLAVIAEKRSYNATRADHQVEARRAAGGKVC